MCPGFRAARAELELATGYAIIVEMASATIEVVRLNMWLCLMFIGEDLHCQMQPAPSPPPG
jgi:hypothetical protein